jgi:thioredoxin reductase (NADPH)
VMLSSRVLRIDEHQVVITWQGGEQVHRNDAVIVCAGGELPTPLLQKMGVQFATKYGDA